MHKTLCVIPFVLSILGGCTGPSQSGDASKAAPAAETAADNSAKNVRDRAGSTLTPGDQSESQADLDLTQRVRQAVVADTSLSTSAHNIKIITVDGVVTLRGPVTSEQEKAKVVAAAQQIAGVKQVENHLEVATQ
jgi:hyperosmotically inducible periplasmic protein